MTPEGFMRLALDAAVAGVEQGRGGPFGAVVVRDGVVVATGVNEVTSLNDPTAHAEVQALRRACAVLGSFSLAGCDVYASCEPCPMCLGALRWARVRAIYFAAARDEAAAAGFDDVRLHDEVTRPPAARLLAAEGDRPFAAWRRKAGRIPY